MSDAPSPASQSALALLRQIGGTADEAIDLVGAALALASLDRPGTELAPYRAHLSELAEDVLRLAGGPAEAVALESRVEALNTVLYERQGYRGDSDSYDDLDNANLLAVIARRKGLPIALGILHVGLARAVGWPAAGINFPGHFLIRIESGASGMIVDPFHGGARREAADLRALLKTMQGDGAELKPEHYAVAGNRAMLLRLQNNIKSRLVAGGAFDRALAVAERMVLIAPGEATQWLDVGVLHARLGNLRAASMALESALDLSPAPGPLRDQAALLLEQVKARLN